MYHLEINHTAEAEIEKIGQWYDKRVPGLSFRFYNDMDSAIKKITIHPSTFGYYNAKRKIENVPSAFFLT